MNYIINKCFCGDIPELKEEHICLGHGDYCIQFYVECTCGLRGKAFDNYHEPFNTEKAKLNSINWWNNLTKIER